MVALTLFFTVITMFTSTMMKSRRPIGKTFGLGLLLQPWAGDVSDKLGILQLNSVHQAVRSARETGWWYEVSVAQVRMLKVQMMPSEGVRVQIE